MRIHHHTGLATVVQFIIGCILTFISGVNSIASSCYGTSGSDCVSNAFVSLLLILLTVGGYAALVAVGFVAQARRSRHLALLLICLEGCAGLLFLFDAKQSPDTLDRIVNLAAFAVATWVAFVAFNLFRSGGARIVRRNPKHVA